MPVVKVSVAIEAGDLAWAKKRAKREKIPLSKVFTEILAHQRRMDALDQLLADMARRGPPITHAELDAVNAELEGTSDRRDVRHRSADRARARQRKSVRAAGTRRSGERKAA